MIRVLVTGMTENYGGVENFIMNQYRAMRSYGDIVIDVMGYTDNPAFKDDILRYGGNIITIPSVRNIVVSRKKIDDYFKKHHKEYVALWCNKCDLFNIDYIKFAHKWDIPHVILHSHSSFNMYTGVKRILVTYLHKINQNKIRHYATDYWACSDYAAEWMFPKSLVYEDKVAYIPNAVDATKFRYNLEKRNEVRRILGLSNETVFGCIGTLSYVKNPIFTLKVFDEFQKKKPNSKLLMIGAGELESQVKEFAETLSCKDKIEFLGIRKDVPDLMQAMDCVLLPSHFEGLPVVAVEAQAAGLHIFVASDGVTKQTRITDFLHFLPLADGAEKWVQTILSTNLEHKDTYDEIVKSGFELDSAALALFNRFENMNNKE